MHVIRREKKPDFPIGANLENQQYQHVIFWHFSCTLIKRR